MTNTLPPVPFSGEWRWYIGEPSRDLGLSRLLLQQAVVERYGWPRKNKTRLRWVTREWTAFGVTDNVYSSATYVIRKQEAKAFTPLPGVYTRNGHYEG